MLNYFHGSISFLHFNCLLMCLHCVVVSCSRPSAPANGRVSTGSFNYNDVLVFTCNSGYRLVGSASATCLANGMPDNSAPVCQSKYKANDLLWITRYFRLPLCDITTYLPVSLHADVNECNDDTLNNCDPNAMCMDQNGTFTCQCRTGFTGDGYLVPGSGSGSDATPGCTSKLI